MKKAKKWFAGILTLAMVLTSVTWPGSTSKVKAAEPLKIDESGYDVTSIISGSEGDVLTSTKKGDKKGDAGAVHVDDNGNYDGIAVSNTGKAVTAKYLKVTYTIPDTSSLKEDSNIFTFQPYTSSWGGWQHNYITFGDAIDNGGNSYTSYIAVRDIKASMDDDQECYGINLCFLSSEPTITITGYDALTVKSEIDLGDESDVIVWADDTKTAYGHESMQKLYLSQITNTLSKYSYSNVSSQKITVYLKITKCSVFSRIKISGGNLDTETITSNKELIGIENTTNITEGSGSIKNNATYIHAGWGTADGYGSGLGAKGTGIYKFAESSITKGAVSGTEDQTQGMWLRRMSNDIEGYICGIKFGSVGSVTISKPDESGNVTVTDGFDESKLESTSKDSTDVKPKSEAELKSDAEDELWTGIRKAKAIQKEDCLTEDLYNELQTEITAAQTALDASDATSTSLTNALSSLNKAIKNATNEAPLGLKKAIDYCKSLKEADYSSESFAKLAPAIATAEEVYAASGSKTDAELKAARDALEAVRVALVPKVSTAESNPKDFRILSKNDVVKEMGAGINLGNTMDGGLYEVSETSWQAYKTTKAYIKALHDAGYNTVRIPVTWGAHIKDDYSIDEEWISRVQEIVDYCVDQDMYAIVNIHHDGAANHDDRGNNTPACWLDTYQWDIEKVYQKYEGVWKTIANRFKDYDEHLIFESMNEVTDAHKLASGQTNEDTAVLNALNQLFVNTVRATGSNNTKRWLGITGRFATFSTGTTMPEDTLADMGEVNTTRLMFAVHIYKGNSNTRWTYANLKEWQGFLSSSIKNVQNLDKNMPLYVGEYGVRTQAQSGSATGYNNAERALNYELCAAVCDNYGGVVPIVWDQGSNNYLGIETQTGLFTDWDRPNLKPVYDDVVHGTIRGTYETGRDSNLGTMMSNIYMSYGHSSTSDNGVSTDPEITPATDITLSDTSVSLKAGERKTVTGESDSSRDVVLWTTDDDSIATVSRGLIHAKNTGITTVHAKTQSGSVVKDIKVIVAPTGNDTATAIKTEKPYYELTEGDTLDIKTTLTPADSKDSITYTSSNTEIATVSGNGKVTAENPGNTYIIVTASSGVSTIVNIKVNKKGSSNSVTATLNLLFGSGITEKSAPVTMTGDGQYTLSYNLGTDLSTEGKNANISKLEKLTSIYIRDTNTLKPVVSQAKIRYDKVVVNDTELTLKKTDDMDEDGFKNLLKASGQLDSNDPINAWDGSAVEEVTVDSKNHVASFTGIDNPQKISVTFTIKDMKFFPVKEKTNEATKLESVTDNKFVLGTAGDTKELELNMTPVDSDSEVTFYSTNSSVAVVNNTSVVVDADGKIKINVTALGEGTATIVGITENGLKVFYTVGVGNKQVSELPDPEDPTPKGLDGSVVEEPTPTPSPSTEPGETPKPGNTPKPGETTKPGETSKPGETTKPGSSSKPGSNSNTTVTKLTQKPVNVSAGKTAKNSITIKWKKVAGADGYIVYSAKASKSSKKFKQYKVLAKNATKVTQKKLKAKTYYMYYVKAYKLVNGKKMTLGTSKTIYLATTGGKYGNATSVKVNKSKVTLKKKKKFKIKAKEINKKKKIKKYSKIRFESSNKKVAKVSSSGKITAVSKGKCTIYVYAQNLKCKKIRVTVK